MDDDLTHTIKIEVTGHYPHGVKEHAIVSVSGSGDADHYLDAIRAAMFAGGFVIETVGRVQLAERDPEQTQFDYVRTVDAGGMTKMELIAALKNHE